MILFEDRAATVLFNILTQIPQKRFLLPLNICPIVPDTFIKAKKEFEFIDISMQTLCMQEDIALKRLQEDSSIDGILFVKTFGIVFNIEPFYKKVKQLNKNIFIIDDMCPCKQNFQHNIEESFADVALFSSGYSKYVDIGYGGYAFIKNTPFNFIFKDKTNEVDFLEYKQKVLSLIPKMDEHKILLNSIYSHGIDKKYHLGSNFNSWRFSILVENKEEILKEIFKNDNLFASSHYPQVDFNYKKQTIENSNTKKVHNKIINLFNDFRFTTEQTHKTIKIINNILQKRG